MVMANHSVKGHILTATEEIILDIRKDRRAHSRNGLTKSISGIWACRTASKQIGDDFVGRGCGVADRYADVCDGARFIARARCELVRVDLSLVGKGLCEAWSQQTWS